MDPTALLSLISEALHEGDYDEATQASEDLAGWLKCSGFEPAWHKYPQASNFFRDALWSSGEINERV